jgi:trimeric autotransporter adhesin
VSVSGGTPPYNVLWSTGGTGLTVNNLIAGSYYCTVTDSHGCTPLTSSNIIISNTGGPVVMLDSVITTQCNDSSGAVYITVSGGSLPYTYLWNNASTAEDLTGLHDGLYIVSVTDALGCIGTLNTQVIGVTPIVQPICIVTVDSTISRNMVVWEKVQTTGISAYKIYRETSQAGVFQVIATIPYDSMSVYTDMAANPMIRSWKYKISAVDACGNQSPLSLAHKTIHLNINNGIGPNDFNLIWDGYEGFTFYSYIICRYRQSIGWETIDTIPSYMTSYTDMSAPGNTQWYTVGAIKPGPACMGSKANGGPYAQSLSNMEDNGMLVGVESLHGNNNVFIYPNPAKNEITIETPKNDCTNCMIEILNLQGQLVKVSHTTDMMTSLEISALPSGMYFVKIKTGNGIFLKKFVKE